ncbi:MAG: hypothetical protein GX962_02600 [Epulopiscium sp.]|nr:hypothetical protein [Candidatus Epulonipiscium sp.]
MKRLFEEIWRVITHRLFLLGVIIVLMLSRLVAHLFQLQIVEGEQHEKELRASILREISIPAPRGMVFDRYGRPLAINKVAFSIKIDDSIEVANQNEILLKIIHLLENNEEQYMDDFPIDIDEEGGLQFTVNEQSEVRFKEEIFGIKKDKMTEDQRQMSAKEMFSYLREKTFKIEESYSVEDARKIMALKYPLYQRRFRQYQPVTIAVDVSEKTVAMIEERNNEFPGLYVDVEPLRYYPEGDLFSHILGYIGKISESQLEDLKDQGYNAFDIVGKTGIEQEMEVYLRGQDGKMMVEVDKVGRRMNVLQTEEAVPGNKIFLTIDRDFQEATRNILVDKLSDILISRIGVYNPKQTSYTLEKVMASMISHNTISIAKILNAGEEFTEQKKIADKLIAQFENPKELLRTEPEKIQDAVIKMIKQREISYKQLVLILWEQGIITGDDEFLLRVEKGNISPTEVIKQKIQDGEITPQQVGLDPSTGSVVVMNIHTGEILSMVSYPSYDNNELVNHFNTEYWNSLLNDPTTPLIHRATMERKAPGSTFKMITALAALEEKVVTRSETILDKGLFTDAGHPPAGCWIYNSYHSTHGYINLSNALEVSCNYYFYEVAYRLGRTEKGGRSALKGINTLNEYAKKFGLDSRSGIEIGETMPMLSTPDNKRIQTQRWRPDSVESELRWYDGDTIRTGIGQGWNNFAPIHMARYMATLANGGTLYDSHIIGKVEAPNEVIYEQKEPIIRMQTDFDQKDLETIYRGMNLVTSGSRGTVRNIFNDFPISVAGKTGTAQEDPFRDSHAWFIGFAPYDNPQIAISVLLPFGNTSDFPAEIFRDIVAAYSELGVEHEKINIDNILY